MYLFLYKITETKENIIFIKIRLLLFKLKALSVKEEIRTTLKVLAAKCDNF
jgi:hypothetical protein